MAEFDDDDDFMQSNSTVPIPYAGQMEQQQQTIEEETKLDPNVHRLDYEDIVISTNDEGKKVINDFLTLEEIVGAGAFCKVRKANGYYKETNDTIPYALKIYKKSTLNQTVNNSQASNLQDAKTILGIRRLRDQMEDEIKIWGNFKHDNVIKSFIWMEDFRPKNPHDCMYLMMQFADMGEIASWKEAEHRY